MRRSSCERAKAFPTAALSTSGIRVEGESFLSACQNKLPCIYFVLIIYVQFQNCKWHLCGWIFPQNRIKVPDARERSAPEGDTPVIMSFVRLSRNNRHIKTELDTDEIRGPTTYVNSKSPW